MPTEQTRKIFLPLPSAGESQNPVLNRFSEPGGNGSFCCGGEDTSDLQTWEVTACGSQGCEQQQTEQDVTPELEMLSTVFREPKTLEYPQTSKRSNSSKFSISE